MSKNNHYISSLLTSSATKFISILLLNIMDIPRRFAYVLLLLCSMDDVIGIVLPYVDLLLLLHLV